MTGASKDAEFNGLVTIKSAGDDLAKSATVTGTDLNGVVQTETFALTNASTATSTKTFEKVTEIKF